MSKRTAQLSRGQTSQRGLSLVELMIAITIGTILIGGIIQIFTSNNAAFRMQQAASRIQENGRFGFRFLVDEMRHAGYSGCSGNAGVTNLLDVADGSEGEYIYDFDKSVQGYYLAEEQLPDELELENPQPVEDTDVLVVRRSGRSRVSASRKQPNANSANFMVDPGHSIEPEDILTVSNCRNAWIVQAVSVQGGNGNNNGNGNGSDRETIVINANNNSANLTPGNKRKLRKNLGEEFTISKTKVTVFYIGENVEGRAALYRRENGEPAEELVAGVEHMRIRYGVDTDMGFVEASESECTLDATSGDGEVDEYLDAHELNNKNNCAWARVIGARMALLLRSRSDRVTSGDAEQEFIFFDPDNPVIRNDGHLRQQVNSTVSFRNKTL